jgi:hypothetical protein
MNGLGMINGSKSESMKPLTLNLEQGSSEWLEARAGLATASRFKDILAKTTKGEYTKKREDYKLEVLAERYGQTVERYVSRDMQIGSETEELARAEYALHSDGKITEVGLFVHPTLKAGASPDGLVNDEGLIEIKCRKIANHVHTLKTGQVPDEFQDQIFGQLWLTGRKWCDYVSYVPELPSNAQLFIKRVYRDEKRIQNLETEVRKFLTELDQEMKFVEGWKLV